MALWLNSLRPTSCSVFAVAIVSSVAFSVVVLIPVGLTFVFCVVIADLVNVLLLDINFSAKLGSSAVVVALVVEFCSRSARSRASCCSTESGNGSSVVVCP